ncbi:hypothetical protein [Streptomyces ochraceiscleroticus]|uniref:Tyr recombinase domain-containing protein n=1 Tax=Streptomyces ochraceiscleroticus TaxID=47761 RepID=A0ABW1MCE4_9ACTN|nr:hypothetical protein [Streptomyces ochraceiscleroticus]
MLPEIPSQRRRTGRGRVSPQPEGFYAPEALREEAGPVVEFFGEDGRRATYSFAELPCPGLHTDLAAAWARRTGATGQLRFRAAADHSWAVNVRLMRWLGELRRPPRTLRGLTLSHLRRFDQHRRMTVQATTVLLEMAQIRGLLKEVQPTGLLREEVREYLDRPGQLYGRWREVHSKEPPPGYSDREFAAIMAAARKDVVAIRQRLRASRTLIERFETAPHTLSEDERARAEKLARMLQTGEVPPPPRAKGFAGSLPDLAAQRDCAGQVFLTTQDLPALMVMGVGLSGRNGETIKELSADFRVLDGRAVAVNLLKRRRNKARTRETIHWEAGSESSRLHTPGGWFLLLNELAESSRVFSRSERVWSIWTGDTAGGPEDFKAARSAAKGHIDPFGLKLGRQFEWNKWVARHGLTADAADEAATPEPLVLTMNRLKKTAEVRTTRAVGGHLPSASRTNTPDVSFLHYLRNDPTIRDWAEQILTEALEDTEASARAFRGRILDEQMTKEAERDPAAAAGKLDTTADKLTAAMGGELDTLVASCLDFEHSPQNDGGLCNVSFLTCLRCPNALVAEHHLPKLFALLRWLQDELDARGVDDWIARHGITWLIITRLILPKFTQAQQEQARAKAPKDLPLHLLDGLKEPL